MDEHILNDAYWEDKLKKDFPSYNIPKFDMERRPLDLTAKQAYALRIEKSWTFVIQDSPDTESQDEACGKMKKILEKPEFDGVTSDDQRDSFQEFQNEDYDHGLFSKAMTYLVNNDKLILHEIRRGDVVQFFCVVDRNDYKVMWDGDKCIALEVEMDEYGNTPQSFMFPEFAIKYFSSSIDHNRFVWLTNEKRQEIVDCYIDECSIVTMKNSVTGNIEIYNVLFDFSRALTKWSNEEQRSIKTGYDIDDFDIEEEGFEKHVYLEWNDGDHDSKYDLIYTVFPV